MERASTAARDRGEGGRAPPRRRGRPTIRHLSGVLPAVSSTTAAPGAHRTRAARSAASARRAHKWCSGSRPSSRGVIASVTAPSARQSCGQRLASAFHQQARAGKSWAKWLPAASISVSCSIVRSASFTATSRALLSSCRTQPEAIRAI